MLEYVEETESGIYTITREGRVLCESKLKIPLVGKGMEHTGEFKHIIKPKRDMSFTLNNRGYYSVVIRKKTYMVHRLVAKVFVTNSDNKPFVNHIDGNKLNNTAANLEWCTMAENNQHAIDTGLRSSQKGAKQVYRSVETKSKCLSNLKDKSKLTSEQVRYVRAVHVPRSKEFSATALAERFGLSVSSMCYVLKRKTYADVL